MTNRTRVCNVDLETSQSRKRLKAETSELGLDMYCHEHFELDSICKQKKNTSQKPEEYDFSCCSYDPDQTVHIPIVLLLQALDSLDVFTNPRSNGDYISPNSGYPRHLDAQLLLSNLPPSRAKTIVQIASNVPTVMNPFIECQHEVIIPHKYVRTWLRSLGFTG